MPQPGPDDLQTGGLNPRRSGVVLRLLLQSDCLKGVGGSFYLDNKVQHQCWEIELRIVLLDTFCALVPFDLLSFCLL